jgi:hypothetical protein
MLKLKNRAIFNVPPKMGFLDIGKGKFGVGLIYKLWTSH